MKLITQYTVPIYLSTQDTTDYKQYITIKTETDQLGNSCTVCHTDQ